MGFFDSVWSNFSNTIKRVGGTINRYLPYVLGGIHKVSKFIENNGIVDAIKAPAGLVAGLAEKAIDLHKYFNPQHPYYNQEGAFVPSVDEPQNVDVPVV